MARFMHGGIIGGKKAAFAAWVTETYLISISANPTVITGLDFGSAVSGINQKWGFVSLLALSDSTVAVTGMSIGGQAGTVVHQTTQAAQAGTGYGTSTFALWTARIDGVTTGATVQFAEDTTTSIYVQVGYSVNIDMSAVVDSAKGTGANSVTLSIDCPAKGLILGHGFFAYSGAGPGVGNVAGGFANLDRLRVQHNTGGTGSIVDAAVFQSAQSGLNVNFAPTPTGARPSAYAVSFAGI